MDRNNWISYTLLIVSLGAYVLFAYFTPRTDFLQIVLLYTLLFGSFIGLIYYNKGSSKFLLISAILVRFVFIIAIPNLSNDFYRFIWDGRMVLEGYNPYLSLPKDVIVTQPEIISESMVLYNGMGELNGSHFTCYPIIKQFGFLVPAYFFPSNIIGSVVVMRLMIIFSDFIVFLIGKRLLEILKIPTYTIFYYLLNPFVIIELTGNLHFEGVMIMFLSISLFFLEKKKNIYASFFLALSIAVKLIPLLFLPLFFKRLRYKKLLIYYTIVGVTSFILFLPFVNYDVVQNFLSSIELYFQNFEFNASIYYIIREIGYFFVGYNAIALIGKILPIITIMIIFIITFYRDNIMTQDIILSMLFAISAYYFLSTTVHPWYIIVLLFLSIFTSYRYPLVWSFVVIVSYSAYQDEIYKENLILTRCAF